jgi:hypothetical protein
MRTFAIVLGLMVTGIPVASAQTPATLDQQVRSGICPSDLVSYKLLSYPEYCSAVTFTHDIECRNDVERMNRIASEYNKFVRKCRAKERLKTRSSKSSPPKSPKVAVRSPMKSKPPKRAMPGPSGEASQISTPRTRTTAACTRCKNECGFRIVDATAKLAVEQCDGADLQCETRIVRHLFNTERYSGCLQNCGCHHTQRAQRSRRPEQAR